jgi:hypothetical protein
MAAPAKYPTVPDQMRALAREARARHWPFELFWTTALRPGKGPITVRSDPATRPAGCLLWPTDAVDRRAWRTALMDAKDVWQAAYEGLEVDSRVSAFGRLRAHLQSATDPDERSGNDGVVHVA